MTEALLKSVIRGRIYKAVGEPYDENNPQYDHYIPEFSGNFWIVDCVICDSAGNVHPEYGKGVPIYTTDLGPIIGITNYV